MLAIILRNRHNFNIVGGILLSAFTNLLTQADNYCWDVSKPLLLAAGVGGLALLLWSGWLMISLGSLVTRWYEVFGPHRDDVVNAIKTAPEGQGIEAKTLLSLLITAAALMLWVIFQIGNK